MTTIRVSRGKRTKVGEKWGSGLGRAAEQLPYQPDQNAYLYESVIKRGIKVPHKAANLKGDAHIVAAPRRVVHEERFKPNTMPRGVDQSITLPHDCRNHLQDVEEVERGWN